MAMPRLEQKFRPKEDQVICESSDEHHPIRDRIHHESQQEKRGQRPGCPFDFYRQNEKQVDHFIRIKPSEGEKQRSDQHSIGKIAAEEKRRSRRADHADEKIERQSERPPGALESLADPPET